MTGGELESWGERVFTDKRVREVLTSLAREPPRKLIEVIEKELGQPVVPVESIKASLGGIMDVASPKASTAGPTKHSKPGSASQKTKYSLDHHLSGKPAAIVDLLEQVDELGRSLGADVSRRINKGTVNYLAGKRSLFQVLAQRQRLVVYLNLDPSQAKPWNDQTMRDVREIGHWGTGSTEYSLGTTSGLDELRRLIKLAYEEAE